MEIRLTEHGDHIAIITIDNQPRRNAMSREMMADLARLWDRLDRSAHRCVIITGAGERAFTSGADLSGDLSADAEKAQAVNRALLKTSRFTKPIIAAVNGDCAGGGVELLLATDIRGMADHGRIGLPEVRWGVYPFGGATVKLIQQIGYVHAMDLLLTGRLIDAQESLSRGIVNRVMPAADVMPWALETAEAIAANSPVAVQAVKEQISATIEAHALSRETLDQELGDRVRVSADFDEGVAAFLEKRTPNYE